MKTPLQPLVALLPFLFTVPSLSAQTAASAADRDSLSALPSITVYASRFEEKLVDASPRTSIVSAADILKSGASNVSEVLARVAGLPTRINLDGSTNAVIDMRGYGDAAPNNVVVLLDGVRLSESEQTVARTSMIPLEAIDHIEITRSGNSVLYGDGANGGTINIVTRRNAGHLSVITGGLASYSGYQSGIYHARPLQASELSLFARQYASDNYRSNARGTELSAGASWIARIDAQTDLGARFFVSQERNKLPGALPLSKLETSPRDTQVPGYNYNANVDASSLTLLARKTAGDVDWAFDINHRTRKNLDAYRYDAYDVFSGYRFDNWRWSSGDSSSRSQALSVSPRVKINKFLLDNNTLQAGYDHLRTSKDGSAFLTFGCFVPGEGVCDSAAFNAGGNTYQITHVSRGAYFRNTLDISQVDRLVAGYRRESYAQNRTIDYGEGPSSMEVSGTAHAGELEYSRKFDHGVVGYVRYSENFRVANADDNSNVVYAPNPVPLRVQTSNDLDIGIQRRTPQSTTEAAVFRSKVSNEIGFDPSGCGYACNVNYDPTRREGLSLRQRLALSRELSVRANVQYTRAQFVQGAYAGKTVPGVAALSGNLSLDYQWSPQEQITLTARMASSRYMSGDFLNAQSRVPGYAVGDVSYIYKQGGWTVVASILNLTNKNYTDTGIYKPSYLSPYQLTVYPNPGRSLSLTGRYAF